MDDIGIVWGFEDQQQRFIVGYKNTGRGRTVDA